MRKLDLRSVNFNIMMVALLYYISGEVAFFFAIDYENSLPLWPPAGIALAFTILYGRSVWPGIAIGSLVISIKNYWFGSIDSVQALMAVTTVIATGSILEALAGELLFRKLVKNTYPFSATSDTFYFVFIALAISWISSSFTSIALYFASAVRPETLIGTLFALWTRNVVGILLFTSLALSLPNLRFEKITLHKAVELAVFILCFA